MSHQWFVVCSFTTGAEGEARRPASTAHAKRMGTISTACGRSAVSMTKLFEVRFSPVRGVCEECVVAVREDWVARRRDALARLEAVAW